MSVRYGIAAIPTVYRGRKYRSRLEARWASFFDLLQWEHEYEPIDFGCWSPDFMLRSRASSNVFVEVKPSDRGGDADVAEKMDAAELEGRLPKGTCCLSVGLGPFHIRGLQNPALGYFRIRWPENDHNSWFAAGTGITSDWGRCVPASDIFIPDKFGDDAIKSFRGVLTGKARSLSPQRSSGYSAHIAGLWAQASNAVQWKPRRGRS